ncbi:uncharacterized protein BDZ99DRAFT_565945 [Mytilinidion resinicola]|uniref:Uncharacterized protein n=1 Tax=Mytilinidion resinicola TaxID=574789 RepID=A0A6A6Z5Y0_9PEZI|nr:uncharacterized protein BDZ99DRAFT_565945 [Mytilinidion resinicola]KAF2816073.1 hypothetical protein BDZ99DRAFT_565945 [Mytilinidion resinicola]
MRIRIIQRSNWLKYRGIILAIAAFFLVSSVLRVSRAKSSLPYVKPSLPVLKPSLPVLHNGSKLKENVRIAKASMLYGAQNEILEGAMQTHRLHNTNYGYEMHVLRQSITNGYWNKFAYLFTLVAKELSKPEEERIEWIMYFDANNIFLNPLIPLSIFLPPPDFADVNMLVANHPYGLSSSVFFLRVCPWSLKLLVAVMGLPMFDSGIDSVVAMDLAWDRVSLAKVLDRPEFRSKVLYQPNIWYNAAMSINGSSITKPGLLLLQFHISLEGNRWSSMKDVLDELATDATKFAMELEDTTYPTAIEGYWNRVSITRRRLREAEQEAEYMGENASAELKNAIETFRKGLAVAVADEDDLNQAISRLREALRSDGDE